MIFKIHFLEGIKSGNITLAFRRWKKPAINAGTKLKTAVGEIEILSINTITERKITLADAIKAGFESKKQLMQSLWQVDDATIYKMEVSYSGSDSRIALRAQTFLPELELQKLRKKLDSLDKHSSVGYWTNDVLTAISKNPKLRAVDLAKKTGFGKDWLKLNIRKLKNLGLTISHDVGYEISPLGNWWLKQVK